jgi:hypothetical protein
MGVINGEAGSLMDGRKPFAEGRPRDPAHFLALAASPLKMGPMLSARRPFETV